MMLRVLDIIEETMVDGVGLRTAIYFSGCNHFCKGCHNPQSWNLHNGKEMTIDELLDIIKADEFANVTFSGGDPLYQCEGVTELARRIKEETDKTIWCYTGFTYEEILANDYLKQILPYIDVLVDGPFIEELRNTDLPFRGSANQRIIELNKI
jgi:anaerobic ribonucleoside-triphosphate reductase activating protein